MALKDPIEREAYQRAYREARRKEFRAYQQARRDACPTLYTDYYAKHFFLRTASTLRRRVRKSGGSAEGCATATDLRHLWKKQRGRCALTGQKLSSKTASLDHICAMSSGGGHGKENLRWVEFHTNMAKRSLTDEDFLRLCSRVVAYAAK